MWRENKENLATKLKFNFEHRIIPIVFWIFYLVTGFFVNLVQFIIKQFITKFLSIPVHSFVLYWKRRKRSTPMEMKRMKFKSRLTLPLRDYLVSNFFFCKVLLKRIKNSCYLKINHKNSSWVSDDHQKSMEFIFNYVDVHNYIFHIWPFNLK